MRRRRCIRGVRSAVAVALLFCGATVATAQSIEATEAPQDEEPVIATSFSALRALVRSGETVVVTLADGTTVRGTLRALSDTSLDLVGVARSSAVTSFTETSARTVRVIRRDSSRDGMLYGLLGGAPPFAAWTASGSGTKRSTAVAVIGGSAVIGSLVGWLSDRAITDAVTVFEAVPASTIEQFRLLTKPGDRLIVTFRDGGRVRGRLSRLTHTSIELERSASPVPMSDVLGVQVERQDRWWPGGILGAVTALTFTPGLSKSLRCSNHGVTAVDVRDGVTYLDLPCRGFATPVKDYVLFGLGGAAAGGTIDWLWRDRATVFRAPASQALARGHVVPLLSPTARGLQVSLSF